jgi:hypothetical protein
MEELNNGVESSHARLINEGLLRLESRLQSEITRVESSVRSQVNVVAG